MTNTCRTHHCIHCCLETEMLLSEEDIQTITNLGYEKQFFVESTNGYYHLKNKNGHCVFHNKKQCTIYPHRPQGCTLYPIIYDITTNTVVLDEECIYYKEFTITKKQQDICRKLVQCILKQREKRIKQ